MKRAKAHLNEAAKAAREDGKIEWVHLCRSSPVPPVFDGSYNHLLWQILARRGRRDLVIGAYDAESFAIARESSVPVAQIETAGWGIGDRADAWKRRLLKPFRGNQQPTRDTRSFLSTAAELIRSLDNPKIMVWGLMNVMPELRRILPGNKIAFAQRHYDYPAEKSHYDLADLIVMQTKGQVRHAFGRMSDLSPLTLVVPNGVELSTFSPCEEAERDELRARWGLPSDRFVALFPSKLAPYKGTSYLFSWIERCRKELPQVHFVIVGRLHHSMWRHDQREIETMLASAANVTWLDGVPRTDMSSLYRIADACLMPALWREGFSMSAVEAMASGLPVVASNSGCYTEILKNDFNGIALEVDDLYEAGFQAIKRLANDRALASRLGRNARRYAEARLSREKVLANFIAVLEGRYEAIDNDLTFPEAVDARETGLSRVAAES